MIVFKSFCIVRRLDAHNNLQCIREDAVGDKDLDLSPSDEDGFIASPLEGESLVWSEQVDLELGEPQVEDCLMDLSESHQYLVLQKLC